MKNLNLKELFGSTVLAFNPDGRTTVKRRSNDGHSRRHLPVGLTKLLSLFILLTLGVGQMWAYDIAAGTTVIWDAGSESWTTAQLYIYKSDYNTADDLTRIGRTTQFYKTYGSKWEGYSGLIFRKDKDWSAQTTDITRNVGSGNVLFTYDNSKNNGKLNWQITTNAKKATSGVKIYFDNTDAKWGEVWLKYGTQWYNRSSAARATQVTGTANLYVITIPNDCYFEKYYLASSYGWTGYNPINDTHVGNRIEYQASNLTSDITYVATGSTSGSSPTVYATTSFSGHTRRLTFGSHTNGQITVRYTDESGVERTVSSASAEYVDVAQTCQVIITAVPNSGYAPSTLTLGGASITSGAQQIIRANGEIAATFVAEETHNVTVSYKHGSRALRDNQVFEVGVTTPASINAEVIDGFSFSSWSNLTNVTNNTGNLTTNPISINTKVSGSDGSMTCNYTPWTCSLDIVPSEGATGHSSRMAMSYDATEKAYYINRTTTSATERYRFYINSIEYSTSGNTKLTIDETKVNANTNVTNYASSKPSVYFNDGPSGSNITIWFDYENKKAWVTEQKHTVTISAGANGSVSPTSVSAGAIKASPSITATPNSHYHLSSWIIPSGVTLASGTTTTSPITIKATADDKIVIANFAGDQYKITYKDQGDKTFTGTQAGAPTTHTYGTATNLIMPTRTGYDFAGWFTASDCKSGAVGNTTSASLGATAFTGNITLYAKWTAKNYTAENNLKDVDNVANGQYNVNYYSTSINHTVAPSKSGYELQGYYKEAACTNLIANADRTLRASTSYTTSASEWNQTSAPVLYLKWTQTVTLNANTANHGSGGNTSATIVYKATAKTSITHCTPATGYHLEGYYTAATDGTKVLNADGSFAAATVTDYITDSKWTKAGETTLYAHYEPNTYDVILDVNGATTGSNQTVVATFDAAMPTIQKTSGAAITAPSKTGYAFGGYWTNAAGTGTQYYTSGLASNHVWDVATNNTKIYAKWTPNNYTVTLNINEANHGTIDGKATSASVTFDAAPTAITAGQLPTAAQGYAFMGFFSAPNGKGSQFINADGTWVTTVTDTISDGKWVSPAIATLYAYYKKAEITDLTLSASTVAPSSTFTVTPTISPDPTGTTAVCWKVLYAANDNELATQPAISTEGTTATITAPATPGTYKVQAILHNTDCNGTELSRLTATFVVAGDHTVTVRYIGDGEQLQASTQLQANQLSWSGAITAPTVSGYTFAGWTAGEGITITGDNGDTEGTSSSNATIKVKATYAGTLTANYVETPTVYFYNNLGWSDVYVTYDAYWTETNTGEGEGTGNWGKTYHKMTRIEGTNIWYDEIPSTYTSDGFSGWAYNIAFNDQNQPSYSHFSGSKVIFRRDFDPYNTMFVPATKDVVTSYKKNNCDYYSSTLDYREGSYYYKGGYWKKYNKKYSGYSLRGEFEGIIGSESEWSGEEHNLYSETTEETANGWETSTSLKLSGNHDYYFRIYRNHLKNDQSSGYTNNGTMTLSSHTDWRFETTDALRNTNCKISTATEGIYTFHVLFDKKGRIYVSVDYPMNVGDYRLLYKDDVHTTWHSSGTIASGNTEDIVSFFSRTLDKNPVIKWQYSTGIANDGTITWSDPADVSLTDWVGTDKVINDSAVYNFKVAYNAQSHTLALTDVKPYTGNYYIRTNSAGKYKWENYLNDPDHMMTYSEYAKTNGDYTHYWMAHVYANANVKFVIANDYSPCISDTLIQQSGDLTTSPAHVDATGNIHANANVRFMWDARNNKVQRAYLADAKEDGTEFLVLIAADDNAMKDANGNNLRQASASDAAGYNHGAPDHAVQFVDNENWIYEANVQLKPSAYVKLYANFDGGDFYYKGNSGSNFDGEEVDGKPNAIQLIGGDADLQNVRVVYDFKTDRLMAAWLPRDAAITTETAINADVMIIRQHQDAGKQITFTGSGKLTDVKTVYGVMQFNRWTLNNKSTADGHAPLTGANSKSIYERALYFISFPFDVKVSEIFGFGKYWDEWYIEYYDGKSRAANGYWIDSEPNWKYVTPEMAKTFELKANQGYILGLDLDYMKDDNTTFWANDMQNVSLYFPSTTSVNNIQATSAVIPALTSDYYCEINRGTPDGDRRVKDSYWRCIGVPSYANYSNTLTDGENPIVWQTGSTLPYIYQWNMTDNTLTPQSTSNFAFLTMHAYLAQYEGAIHWSAVSATPSPVVARRTADETIQDREFRLELAQAQKMLDQTYVRLSMDEEVTTGFEFNHDLTKEINAGKANIYTYIGYEKAAANCLPMNNQTTIVPMGVQIAADGEYTFAMPDGTNGTGVTLIDNETGTRTSLALTDYTVTLAKGTYDNRFVLEFSPVAQTPTGIEDAEIVNRKSSNRKLLIDGILYIVKDGQVFDARGTKVK